MDDARSGVSERASAVERENLEPENPGDSAENENPVDENPVDESQNPVNNNPGWANFYDCDMVNLYDVFASRVSVLLWSQWCPMRDQSEEVDWKIQELVR